jgi:hypothetical protein
MDFFAARDRCLALIDQALDADEALGVCAELVSRTTPEITRDRRVNVTSRAFQYIGYWENKTRWENLRAGALTAVHDERLHEALLGAMLAAYVEEGVSAQDARALDRQWRLSLETADKVRKLDPKGLMMFNSLVAEWTGSPSELVSACKDATRVRVPRPGKQASVGLERT